MTGRDPSWSSHPARLVSFWCSRLQAMACALPYLLVTVTVRCAGSGQVPGSASYGR